MSTPIVPKQYMIKLDGAEKNILRIMNKQRKDRGRSACEVVLLANGIKHYAHKIVLISYSDFFRGYFEEKADKENSIESEKDSDKCKSDDEIVSLKSNDTNSESSEIAKPKVGNGQTQTMIHLPGINSVELDPILEYMYTSRLALRAENVNEILLVGCLLQITSVIEFCAEVLLKQPSWKSPLVSPRVLNYVQRRDSLDRADDGSNGSSTAVTWAENGGRPASHEIKLPRQRGRSGAPLLGGYGSIAQQQPSQRGVPVANTSVSRKRRHPNFQHQDGRAQTQNDGRVRKVSNRASRNESSRKNTFSDEPNKEIQMTIDYDELNRELALHALQRARQHQPPRRFQQQYPPSPIAYRTAPPPLVDTRNVARPGVELVEISKRRPGSGSSSQSGSPPSRIPNSGRHYDNEIGDSFPANLSRRYSGEDQQISMFPQISDCNRIIQAACASALAFPMFPPGYGGLPFVNPIGRIAYPQNIASQTGIRSAAENQSENNYPRGSHRSPPKNGYEENVTSRSRYSATLSAVYSSPLTFQEYDTAHNSSRSDMKSYATESRQPGVEQMIAHSSRRREGPATNDSNGSAISLRVPYRLGFKRFTPNVIQHRETTSEDEGLGQRNATDGGATSVPSDSLVQEHSSVENAPGYLSINTNEVCFSRCLERKPETQVASSVTDVGRDNSVAKSRGHHAVNTSDYLTKKRKRWQQFSKIKLQRSAQEPTNIESVNQCDHPRSAPEKPHRNSKERKTQCSSEDDIIARECDQVDGSDLDSDDSGRPSSV